MAITFYDFSCSVGEWAKAFNICWRTRPLWNDWIMNVGMVLSPQHWDCAECLNHSGLLFSPPWWLICCGSKCSSTDLNLIYTHIITALALKGILGTVQVLYACGLYSFFSHVYSFFQYLFCYPPTLVFFKIPVLRCFLHLEQRVWCALYIQVCTCSKGWTVFLGQGYFT